MKVYPLKLRPIHEQRIWGGQKLREFFNKDIAEGSAVLFSRVYWKSRIISSLVTGELKGKRNEKWKAKSVVELGDFGEEFLFRGALQTRLRALLSPSWAIVIQALLFGIWHFAKNFAYVGINGTAAVIAFSVVGSAVGLALGIIFERTRNLLACSVIHVVANSLGG